MSFAEAAGAYHPAPKPASTRIPARGLHRTDNLCRRVRDVIISPVSWPNKPIHRLNASASASHSSQEERCFSLIEGDSHEAENKFYALLRFLLRYHFPLKVAIYFRLRYV